MVRVNLTDFLRVIVVLFIKVHPDPSRKISRGSSK